MSDQSTADARVKTIRKRSAGPSLAEKKLMAIKEAVNNEIAPPATMTVKNLAPNYRGPSTEQRCVNLGIAAKLPPFVHKPKMALGVDIGQRRIGFFLGWGRSARDPLVWLYEENIDGFPNYPISVEYLHRVNNTVPLPEGVLRWDEINTLESAQAQDVIDDARLRAVIQEFRKENLPPPPNLHDAHVFVRKRSSMTILQLKQAMLETFFDTTQDKNYMTNRTMDRSTFAPIPKKRTEIDNGLRDTIMVYAKYLRETYGKIDVIFLEEQDSSYGEQGTRDQASIKIALEWVFPRSETTYRDPGGKLKLAVFPFSWNDVVRLQQMRVWRDRHFASLGPSGRLALMKMEIPEQHRHILHKYREVSDEALDDEKAEKVPAEESAIGRYFVKNNPQPISAATSSVITSLCVPPTQNPKKRTKSQVISRVEGTLAMLNGGDDQEPETKRFKVIELNENDDQESTFHYPIEVDGVQEQNDFGASTEYEQEERGEEQEDSNSEALEEMQEDERQQSFGDFEENESNVFGTSTELEDDDNVLAPVPGISKSTLPLMSDIYRSGHVEFSVEHILYKFKVNQPK